MSKTRQRATQNGIVQWYVRSCRSLQCNRDKCVNKKDGFFALQVERVRVAFLQQEEYMDAGAEEGEEHPEGEEVES